MLFLHLPEAKMSLVGLLVSVTVLIHSRKGAEAFSNGLVTDACHTLVPGHSPSLPQTSPAPYNVYINASNCTPGGAITVTLNSSAKVFEGFLLQARKVGGHVPIGRFISIDTSQAQGLNCNNATNSSVSHKSEMEKTTFQATWEAPADVDLCDIQFSITFVQNYSMFWVNVKSSTVRVTSASQEPNISQNRWCLIAVIGLAFSFIIVNPEMVF